MYRNKAICALLVLCAAMQIVALMPHHHHDDSEAVCINFLHLTHSDCNGGHDCCETSHNEHDGHGHSHAIPCNSHNFIIAQHDRTQTETAAKTMGLPSSVFADNISWLNESLAVVRQAHIAKETYDRQPDVVPPVMRYISRVLSSRAPSRNNLFI